VMQELLSIVEFYFILKMFSFNLNSWGFVEVIF